MIVITIVAITGTVALPLFNQALTHSRLDAAASAVAGALNYARVSSLTSQRSHQVDFDASANSFAVLRYNFHRLDRLQDTSRATLAGDDVDFDYRWEDVAHPVNDAGLDENDQRGYAVTFATESIYQGVDITAAAFGAADTVTFGSNGLPNSGGTVTLQLGGLQRQITVNAGTGAVSTS